RTAPFYTHTPTQANGSTSDREPAPPCPRRVPLRPPHPRGAGGAAGSGEAAGRDVRPARGGPAGGGGSVLAARGGAGVSELAELSLQALGAELRARRVSPVEATEACLARIAARDGEVNSFLTLCAHEARAEARAMDAELAAGRYRGPLHGVPLALKDLFLTRG